MEKYFFWSNGGLILGQTLTHTKTDYLTKNGPKSSNLEYFSSGKAQNDENLILYTILKKSNF
jgi:hypothetical protein